MAAVDVLPYPYVTQYDPQQQATFYANTETGETSWHIPEGARGGLSSHNFDSERQPGQPMPPVRNEGAPSRGEAASFYAGSGVAPQAPNQGVLQSDDGSPQRGGTRAFGSKQDERAQFGQTLGASGVAAMAWKMYKDYRNGKHNKQQYRPPSGSPSMLGGMGGMSSLLGGSVGPTMYPSGGGGRPQYGAGQGRFGNEHGRGHQQYGTHGRPDDRMSAAGGGLLSSLLDGGPRQRPYGSPEYGGGMFGSSGVQGGAHYGGRDDHRYGHGDDYRHGPGGGRGGYGPPRGGGGGRPGW